MQPDKPNDLDKSDQDKPLSSPYGPHPDHVDEASGGADSSPFETLSSDERDERLKAARRNAEKGEDADSSRH